MTPLSKKAKSSRFCVSPALFLSSRLACDAAVDEEITHKERCMNIYVGNLSFDETESSLETEVAPEI